MTDKEQEILSLYLKDLRNERKNYNSINSSMYNYNWCCIY